MNRGCFARGLQPIVVWIALHASILHDVSGVYLPGSDISYLRYPKWNSCQNSSITFDFRTTQTDGLLLYADDGGHVDFLEISFNASGLVLAVFRIAEVRMLSVGPSMIADGRWHRVEFRRNGPQTTLSVDGTADSIFSFGTDSSFGTSPTNNSHVFMGGLPASYTRNLRVLSLPSSMFKRRFNGHLRNVIFGNCSCLSIRARPIEGVGNVDHSPETCDTQNSCAKGCLCISTQTDVQCDCSEKRCIEGIVTHYELSLDGLQAGETQILVNNTEFVASVKTVNNAEPKFLPGILGRAIKVGWQVGSVEITGPDHHSECFGNLDVCSTGFTFGVWLNFSKDCENEFVVLSSGAHSNEGHGVAMFYSDERLKISFRKRNGTEWMAEAFGIIPEQWYYIAATWRESDGVTMYVNDDVVDINNSYTLNLKSSEEYNRFTIGGPNIGEETQCTVLVDEFNFWSKSKTKKELKELGPIFCYEMLMNSPDSVQVLSSDDNPAFLSGFPTLVDGKIDKALEFDGERDYIDGNDQSNSCLGDLSLCKHGLTVSMWIWLRELPDNTYLFSTGYKGMEIFYSDDNLVATAQEGLKYWKTTWNGVESRVWYFFEVTWSPVLGLKMYVNQKLVSQTSDHEERITKIGKSRLYIGRANTNMTVEKFASAAFNQIQLCHGDRNSLAKLDIIQRGKPKKYSFDMDTIVGRQLNHTNPDLTVNVDNSSFTVPGKINNSTRLNGTNQCIDIKIHVKNCLSNLALCRHGFTGTMWAKFRNFLNGMYYVSNGNGVEIFYTSGELNFVFTIPTKQWNLKVMAPATDVWHFLEYSWSMTAGLKVFLNGELKGRVTESETIPKQTYIDRQMIRIGCVVHDESGNFRAGNFLVDETEFWFSDRDSLLAFDYVARGNISHMMIPFEVQQGSRVLHENFTITLHNGASLVNIDDKFGNGLQLKGSKEYASLGDQKDSCTGNIEKCSYGLTITFFIKLRNIHKDAYLFSSGTHSIHLKSGRCYVEFMLPNKTWEVSMNGFEKNRWYRLEVSWDEDKGLQFYVDKRKVAHQIEGRRETHVASDYTIYLGRPSGDDESFNSPDVLIDQMEFWFANRDHVMAFGLLEDDINGLCLDMKRIDNDLLYHQTHVVYVHGFPKIVNDSNSTGILLNGLNQYLDLGKDVICKGNLENCQKGFTVRFKIKPLQLLENTYFISSSPADVYYHNNHLFADVRTPVKEWTVSTPDFKPNAWNQVDVSWHPVTGVDLFVDNELVAKDSTPVTNEHDYNATKRFLIGKANTDMRHESYANAIFDDVEFWEGTLTLLKTLGHTDVVVKESGFTSSTRKPSKVTRGRTTATLKHKKTTFARSSRMSTRAFYLQVPTGKTIRTTTLSSRSASSEFFHTLPQNAKKMLIFDGTSFISYDVSQFPDEYVDANTFEQLHIKLKTTDSSGLLLYSGNADQNIHLSLKGGSLLLIINYDDNLSSEKFRAASPNFRLDDNEWHNIYITRNERHVTVTVDGNEFPKSLLGDIDLINPGKIYIAGSLNTKELTNFHMRNNFRGMLDKFVFSGDNVPSEINLIDLTFMKPTPPYIEIFGNVNSAMSGNDTETAIEPVAITFTQEKSFIRLPLWEAEHRGSLELHFKTVEPHGLLLYNGGQPGHSDFFAVELFDGMIYAIVDLGSGVQRYPFNLETSPVNDGLPHFIRVDRVEKNLKLTLDKDERSQTIASAEGKLDLGTFLYLGAVDNPNRLPWHLWTRNPKFFVGCVWGMKTNDGEVLDLPSFIVEQGIVGIEPGCKTKPLECAHSPCSHGTCADRWNGYSCRCEYTGFTGKMCHLPATMVAFTGNQLVNINIHPILNTHTNDISLRFKTPRDTGFLFMVTNHITSEYFKAFLDRGKAKLETNLGGQSQPFQIVLKCDDLLNLNDDQWHTVHIRRRANFIAGWVDNCTQITVDNPGEGYTLDIDQILIARQGPNDPPEKAFVGHMQNFIFGPHYIFESLQSNVLPGISIDNTGEITEHEKPIPMDSITLKSMSNSFLDFARLELPKKKNEMIVSFMFRTSQGDGILLFQAGIPPDYLAVELSNGSVRFLANDGSGTQESSVDSPPLDDSEWHVVEIRYVTSKSFNVTVDNVHTSHMTFPQTRNDLELVGNLYFGGVPEHILSRIPAEVVSKTAFGGCLASFYANGKLYRLPDESITKSLLIRSGCLEMKEFCSPNMCKHRGVCSEVYNNYFCDCNMTAFVGRKCDEEAEGYHFGMAESGGLGSMIFDPPVDTGEDRIAFGIMTWYPNGSLVRIDSNTTSDFIEIFMENCSLHAVFNVGGLQQQLMVERCLNDSLFHRVYFVRTSGHGILRVDDLQPKEVTAEEEESNQRVFSEMSVLKFGGKVGVDGIITSPFNGIISGLFINGLRVVDIGIYNSSEGQVQMRGDIVVAAHPFHIPRPQIHADLNRPTASMVADGKPTVKPGSGTMQPDEESLEDQKFKQIPLDIGGGGVGWKAVIGTEGVGIILNPNGIGGGGINTEIGDGVEAAESVVGGVAYASKIKIVQVRGGDPGESPRASFISGVFLGVLLAALSLVWAFYKCKPGIPGAKSASNARVMSSVSATNYYMVSPARRATIFQPSGECLNNLMSMESNVMLYSEECDLPGTASQTFLTAIGGINLGTGFAEGHGNLAGSGIAGLETGSGTVTRGTQSDLIFTGLGNISRSTSMIAAYGSTRQSISNDANIGIPTSTVETQTIPDDDPEFLTQNLAEEETEEVAAVEFGSGYDESLSSTSLSFQGTSDTGFSCPPALLPTAPEYRTLSPTLTFSRTRTANAYRMQNMTLKYSEFGQMNRYHQENLLNDSTASAFYQSPQDPCKPARIDCMLLTKNGNHIVTGSVFGPPMVWDIKTAELIKIMEGNFLSSTDIHLGHGDALLVGRVAKLLYEDEMDENTCYKCSDILQIWDFSSGLPLDMPFNESFSASCLMNDNEHIALGRVESFGSGITVVLWDLLGNERKRCVTHEIAVNPDARISFVAASEDSCFIATAFQNDYDDWAKFVVFNMAYDSIIPAKIITLNSLAEVSTVIDVQEMVTGTRQGELIIWSLSGCKILRHFYSAPSPNPGLMSKGTAAHESQVTAVDVSRDHQLLVSASTDRTLKLWCLHSEQLLRTLEGHTDEVTCCAFSNDAELVASGSQDCTIRLWRTRDGLPVSVFKSVVDIFKVMISENKHTVAALGDRNSSRKLILLQVKRSKTES